ncbi:restriction endonuclease subunit S [Dickeya zeae]|uniref:restriction endonuclease subunit S n=1 Tax=Dickeya zeae TaxID=204042 RepID=UPI000C9AE866|nr:restriction endonuclease subunit S [Dickeya zeae]AUQ27427.1 restriction endonuclease subunit S [Dickeya zeae]UJR60481.1 restriction endonuclease subunit S [Dickeya zeae]
MTKLKPLRELVNFKGGGTPSKKVPENWNGDIPWASVKDFTSTSLSKTQDSISQEGLRNSSANLIPKGHVIIPTRMSLGKAAINTVDLAINQDLRALIPKVPLDTRFLLHAVLSLKDEIIKKGSGATVKGITQEELYKLEIAFPPLDDQIRIAHLLGKVEALITQRKHHLQQLDDIIKSVFLEMFGDPVRNEKGWDKIQFSELLAEIESGKSPKCEARKAESDEWGVLKLGAVTRCKFDETENKALPNDVIPSTRDEVKAGDLLFSRKNTYELVAACAYVFSTRPKLLMPDLIFRFIFKQDVDINPIFMWKLLTCDSQRKAIQSLAAGAAGSMPNISKTNLKSVRLPKPPLSLQNQFATIVEKVESIKSHYQQSLTDLEALYGSLSQQAFRGELDLSRVPLPDQSVADVSIEEYATEPKMVVQTEPAIHLPATDNLSATLENAAARKALMARWLEAYRTQLGETPFSAQQFITVAQARLAELHPDHDIALGASDYENIKTWVFEQVRARRLKQTRDIILINNKRQFGNRLLLRARRQPDQ